VIIMKYTFPIAKEMVCAKSTLPISRKKSVLLSRKLNNMKFERAFQFMSDLVSEKINIDGKFYTKPAAEIYKMMKTLDANAIAKGVTPSNMIFKMSVSKGRTLYRGRRKRKFGLAMKTCNVHMVLK